MKAIGRKVFFTEVDWADFFRGFPGSVQSGVTARGFFEFDESGNLVDLGVFLGRSKKNLSGEYDGYELVAFSHDAQKLLDRDRRRGSGALSGAASTALAGAAGAAAGAVGMHLWLGRRSS